MTTGTPDTPDWFGTGQAQPAGTPGSSEVSVTTTAGAINPATGQLAIALLADKANGGTIYVGASSGVSSSDWPLAAGEYLALEVNATLWVVASTGTQTLHVFTLSS